jgi:GNAT superfamily N-acetyltransferase
MEIIQARIPDHEGMVRDLFGEYLRWVCAKIYQEYHAVFDAEAILAHDMETIDIFLPPKGLLLLAIEADAAAGCACTRTIGEKVGEMKRMYVRPEFRKQGIGSRLVHETIRLARVKDQAELRLDSAGFMSAAHSVYHAAGFSDIPPYEGSEIPKEYQEHWVFMALKLK